MLDKIALTLLIIGGLNWGSVGIFQFDLVAWICGGQTGIISRIVYILVGLSAIWCITLLFRDTSDTVTDGTVADSQFLQQGQPCGRMISAHTFKRNFYIYKNSRATMICILQTVCPTAIFNFPFSTFNFKKLSLGHNMFFTLQTVYTKGERRLAVK